MILTPHIIQNFLYNYILDKIKSERFAMLVDSRYEKFLNSLPNPLQLNDMRTMKPDKFIQMRNLLSNYLGSPVLRIIKDNAEALDLDPDVFNLVYEGFWDLYTFKDSQLRDVSARKLQTWIQKIKLISGPDRTGGEGEQEGAENAGEGEGSGEENEESKEEKPQEEKASMAEDVYDPVTCVVRLKIPKVPVEPELDDEGNPIPVEVNESDLDDIPFEDRCLQSLTKQEDQQIWVFNQLAQKTLRTDLSNEFRNMCERLEHIDTSDFNYRLEKEAAAFE